MGLLNELKRRNVPRMAALYVVAAWLIMQVTDVLQDLADLPDWVGPVVLWLLAIGFPIALVISWFYEITPQGIERDTDDGELRATHLGDRRIDFVVIAVLCAALLMFAYDKWWTRELAISSVAVLPISALGANPEFGYVAAAMTESLISELGRIRGLRVTSRTSSGRYQASDKKLPEIAGELGVDALIEGSVQLLGDSLKIDLRLIEGRSDRQMWSGVFDRELGDLLTVQGEIAREIADEINISLAPEARASLSRNRQTSPEAVRYWAVGTQHLQGANPDSFDRALASFKEAVKKDPEFADAYAGIAQGYFFQGTWHGRESIDAVMQPGLAAADTAIRLNPDLASAYLALGMLRRLQWDLEGAERAFRKALDLNPSDYVGLVEVANYLIAARRFDEAIDVAESAVLIDPLSPAPLLELGFALQFDGQGNAALERYGEALALEPDRSQTHALFTMYYLEHGRQDLAMPHIEQLEKSIAGEAPSSYGILGLFYGLVDMPEKAEAMLKELQAQAQTQFVPATSFAYVLLALGKREEALDALEKAYEQRDFALVWLNHFRFYDPIRDEPRFQALVAKLNLPSR
jgi:TolB-like protein